MVMKKASGDDYPLWQGARKSFWTLPISEQGWRQLAVCFVEKCFIISSFLDEGNL
jgi:hypothetical protein